MASSRWNAHEGSPGHRLLHVAEAVWRVGNHRFAAFVYSTVATSSSGTSPRVQAYSLLRSSEHLLCANYLLPLAANYLRRSLLILRNEPDFVLLSLEAYALLERVYDVLDDT